MKKINIHSMLRSLSYGLAIFLATIIAIVWVVGVEAVFFALGLAIVSVVVVVGTAILLSALAAPMITIWFIDQQGPVLMLFVGLVVGYVARWVHLITRAANLARKAGSILDLPSEPEWLRRFKSAIDDSNDFLIDPAFSMVDWVRRQKEKHA